MDMEVPATKGLIFDIQGHSVHDGPGTRTVVFMSGCPMRCKWCANPEGQLLRPRLMYKSTFCTTCPFRCIEACRKGAISPSKVGRPPIILDRNACDSCETMYCTKVCYMQALQVCGRWYTVEELIRLLNRDRCYWGPAGGVTLSGGEPLVQQDFVRDLLKHCNDAYISACVETTAYVPRSALQSVLPFVQWLFIDIKHMDSTKHIEGTGVPNKRILDNIRWLTSSGWPGRMIIRVPLIAGYNDTAENARATANFLRQLDLHEVNLLPFHRLAGSKYDQLDMAYDFAECRKDGPASVESLAQIFRTRGIACYLGSDTPF